MSAPSARTLLLAFLLAGALAGPANALGADGPAGHPDSRTLEADAPTRAERAVAHALEAIGIPYRWGGESPASGFDCSGLVRWAYGRVGVDLPHNSYALYGVGRRVSAAAVQPGDVLFFEGLGHVGLYVGGGRMVHAPQSGRHVEVVRLDATNYGRRLLGARRVAFA